MISNIPKEPTHSGFQSREMDEMRRKNKQRIEDDLRRRNIDLTSKKRALQDLQDRQARLQREIKLEGQSRTSNNANSILISEVKNLERQNIVKIAEAQKEIKAIEQEGIEAGRSDKSKAALIAQKQQEEKQDSKRIVDIKKEIERKNEELQKILEEDKRLQQEIIQLKGGSKNGAQDIAGRTAKKEALKREMAALEQSLGVKKQQADKTVKDSSVEQERSLQAKKQESVKIANDINGLEQAIEKLDAEIQALQTAQKQAA